MNIFFRWFTKNKIKKSILFRKFTPITDEELDSAVSYKNQCRPFGSSQYIPFGVFPDYDIYFKQQQFNKYLLNLKFVMTPKGIVRQIDNKPAPQCNFEQYWDEL